jgi:hypothetical protein
MGYVGGGGGGGVACGGGGGGSDVMFLFQWLFVGADACQLAEGGWSILCTSVRSTLSSLSILYDVVTPLRNTTNA